MCIECFIYIELCQGKLQTPNNAWVLKGPYVVLKRRFKLPNFDI